MSMKDNEYPARVGGGAILPEPGDNAAIAAMDLPAGALLPGPTNPFRLSQDMPQGHRLAVRPIDPGEALLSWGFPFGRALRRIDPGERLFNLRTLDTLRGRGMGVGLPERPNFEDQPLRPFDLPQAAAPSPPRETIDDSRTYQGYRRTGERGVGTRNHIVILGVTSGVASFARALADRLKDAASGLSNFDGIVAVAHTEGGEADEPNNAEVLLRTLAGFMVHPNVGAVLAVDQPGLPIDNDRLRRYMVANDYPLHDVLHAFFSFKDSFEAGLEKAAPIVRGWLPRVSQASRTPERVSTMRVSLQCGGSDAFSGISGNPLAGWAAHEFVRRGGVANLAETPELIGAEGYILRHIRNPQAATRFLTMIERFKERLAWHGHSAEENPSAGNLVRGLCNITLKSLGAGRKMHPDLGLDHCIEYGERMREPGFYFMDTPGNDLESVAGQAASGCTVIYFVTGAGSITNFPFIPTIKIVTTTERFRLLGGDLDVNAGECLDGIPMETLGADLFERTLRVASGEWTAGEKAGHSQVSIWRNWRQTGPMPGAAPKPVANGAPLRIESSGTTALPRLRLYRTGQGFAADRVGLIAPTSLCASQIAALIATRLNRSSMGAGRINRFVAIPHTEGCGSSSGESEATYTRMLLGHAAHPSSVAALFLEHGCEKTHNDHFRRCLQESGRALEDFGWVSIQLDGGIERAEKKAEDWFASRVILMPATERIETDASAIRVGLAVDGAPDANVADLLAGMARAIAGAGGTVVLPHDLWQRELRSALEGQASTTGNPTLSFGAQARGPGLHIMETPTRHWVETATGLAATGVDAIFVIAASRVLQGHPLVPVVQAVIGTRRHEADLSLEGDPEEWLTSALGALSEVLSGERAPVAMRGGNVDFQITRGLLGVSV